MQDFSNFEIWQKGGHTTLARYQAALKFSKDERYGLTGQIIEANAQQTDPQNKNEGLAISP